jgi:alkylated DNA nucleotide flippase Atl1
MATKTKRARRMPAIEPTRLYTYEEIAGFFGAGTTARQVKRWVEEGKIAYTVLPNGRWRRISGRQYLAALRDGAVEAEV